MKRTKAEAAVTHQALLDAAFTRHVTVGFGEYADFRIQRKVINEVVSVVANFEYGGFPVEIFGQAIPVEQQRAYRHLLVEERLLKIGGAAARDAIRQLKRDGLKTEPAFAQYFGLSGDPYLTLLELGGLDDDALREIVT